VMRHKRQVRTAPSDAPRARAVAPSLGMKDLRPAELVILGALYDDELKRKGWEAIQEGELFTTKLGSDLAAAIRGAFPDGPPVGTPAAWLGHLEPEPLREEMARLQADPRVERITRNYLEDAVAYLREQQEKRSFDDIKLVGRDDTSLKEIQERLRKLKKTQD
jgi:hypothetical protein